MLHHGLRGFAVSAAEKRQAEAARIRDKYPDRIPVRVPAALLVLPYCCGSSARSSISPSCCHYKQLQQ